MTNTHQKDHCVKSPASHRQITLFLHARTLVTCITGTQQYVGRLFAAHNDANEIPLYVKNPRRIMDQNNALSVTVQDYLRLLALLSLGLAIAGLCGWAWHTNTLDIIMLGLASMKTNTAVGLVLSGTVFYLQQRPIENGLVPWIRRMGTALVLSIGLLTLGEYLFQWDAGIDELLTHGPADTASTPFPGRMSLLSAGCFVLAGSMLLLSELRHCRSTLQGFAAIAAIITMLPLIGYLFGELASPHISPASPILHTAQGGVFLCMAVITIISLVLFFIRLRKKLPLLGASAALTLLLLSGAAVLQSLEQGREAARRVEQSYDVMLHMESAISNLRNYKTEHIAFAIDARDAHLQAAKQANKKLRNELDAVKRLTSVQLIQQQKLSALSPVIDRYFAAAGEPVIRNRAPDISALSSDGAQTEVWFNEIVQQLYAMKEAEQTLLLSRQTTAINRNVITTATTGFTILFSLLLLLTTFRALHREIAQHLLAEKSLKDTIILLNQHEKQLEHLAHYDALTGLPNRVLLADRMNQAILRAKREQKMLGVCYLDLDGFKAINDECGHQAGDQALIAIAGRLLDTLRECDTIARLGGDEFVVLLPGLNNVEECVTAAQRLNKSIAEPVSVQDQSHALSASIGITIFPYDDNDPGVLLRHADQAMYMAKQSGKNRCRLYDHAQERQIRSQPERLEDMATVG
jgi:diguanylate cyclase (GGDEF)-like protein